VFSGLKVSSEFKFSIAQAGDFKGHQDVTISFEDAIGYPQDATQHPTEPGVFIGKNDLRFTALDGLYFRIIDGKKIVIERGKGISDADVNLFIVGSCFGVLCLQRGLIPIHCSAIEYNGKAVTITGSSGVGKSTTAAALSQLGYPHVCDDVLVIDPTHIPYKVTAMPKGLKLWEEAAQELQIEPETRATTIAGLNKYYVSPANTQASERLSFDTLYIMDEEDADEFKITEIKGMEKHSEIRRAIYREEWLDFIQPRGNTFEAVTELASNLKVFKFKRRDDLSSIYDCANFLISHFTKEK
jgi:hypothetical protein